MWKTKTIKIVGCYWKLATLAEGEIYCLYLTGTKKEIACNKEKMWII